jgi:hypothetical protein
MERGADRAINRGLHAGSRPKDEAGDLSAAGRSPSRLQSVRSGRRQLTLTRLRLADAPHPLRAGEARQRQRRSHTVLKKGYGAVGVVVGPSVGRAMSLITAVAMSGSRVKGGVKPRVGLRRGREQPKR